jgi:adenylosuccinate lyase
MVEGIAQQHERDGRGWKAEWVALPEACLLTAAALRTAAELTGGLRVDAAAMRRNAERDGYAGSERALGRLAPELGARRTQALLQEVLAAGLASGVPAARALAEAGLSDGADPAGPVADLDTGACAEMVDLVVSRARAARAAEPPDWP